MAAAVASGRSLDAPRKKRSFMSLKRDKSAESKVDKATPSPSFHSSTYFEAYPTRGDLSHQRQSSRTTLRGDDNVIPFPSVVEKRQDLQSVRKAPRSSQKRPSTAPLPDPAQLPPLRFSGSSAISHSPPHTPTSPSLSPLDDLSSIGIMPSRLMAAPIVETTAMDALVDGMNGGEEDIFSTMEALRGPRRRRKSSTKGFHHPLYHPPLPTPPPGIKLGVSRPTQDSDAEDGSSEDMTARLPPPPRPRPSSSSKGSTSTITASKQHKRSKDSSRHSISPATPLTPSRTNTSDKMKQKVLSSSSSPDNSVDTPMNDIIRRFVSIQDTNRKAPVPSIDEIIRTHAPGQQKSRLSATVPPPVPEHPERRSLDSPSDLVSRSSMDSVAEEVQQTLRVALKHPSAAVQYARAFPPREDKFEPGAKSDSGHGSPSISSFGTSFTIATLPNGSPFKTDSNHALATFLRSPRLTRLLKLRRHPNQRLQVSFSDLGSSSGKPVVVFLGLGCVRYIMGLYDEMAEALGLRLITIDRWGLGKTDTPGRSTPRGVKEWACVVEEVLDYLNIDRYSLLAHSAGAPYAMALANRAPHKVQGPLGLLAPWVGAGEGASGYKWLKYVPTGLIKTAQAAEWKMQAWMLGKPPVINTGIGYTPQKPVNNGISEAYWRPSMTESVKSRETGTPSIGSFSDYDDLADFQGQYGSGSTVHIEEPATPTPSFSTFTTPTPSRKRTSSKTTRFFGGLWKNGDNSPPGTKTSPKLKSLKSMGSLKGAAKSPKGSRSQTASDPAILEDDWSTLSIALGSPESSNCAGSRLPDGSRGNGRARRSISLSAPPSIKSQLSHASSRKTDRRLSSPPPQLSSFDVSSAPSNAALGNALLAASHAESERGMHADLLVILNHSQKPWGFSYENFPLKVKVWYGDKDEKIAEGAVRWLERTMPPNMCELSIIKGAGHALLYNGDVVVEALELLKESWQPK